MLYWKGYSTVIFTILGVSNLDFLHLVISPLCISTSLKAIDILYFDYITALYPILMTVIAFILIEHHDNNCKLVLFSFPIREVYIINSYFQRMWNPKKSVVSTFATFILLSYIQVDCSRLKLCLENKSADMSSTL